MVEEKISIAKQAAGYAAMEFIKDGMIVGLGTGSTVEYFLDSLSRACKYGLRIQTISSSKKTQSLALEKGIPVLDPSYSPELDITVDGADEVDPERNLIKGHGGALLREKILAFASSQLIIIVDQSKCVDRLGKTKLPVEIAPFCYELTILHLKKLGYLTTLRLKEDKEKYVTDNGNFIVDIFFPDKIQDAEKENLKIKSIPGVVETGFFLGIASKVIVGSFDGKINYL